MIWMTGFTVIPLLMVFCYGLTDRSGAFTLANILAISSSEHLKALWLSLALAGVSTVICLLLAYPLALILRKRHIGKGSFVVFIFILPMWMNFLLRTLAWQTLLEKNGVINSILSFFHLPGISIINTPGAIILGMVYNFLPFMILPVQAALERIPGSLLQASADLGADPRQTFRYVVLPLAIPGIAAGSIFTFSLTLGDFIVPQLVGPPGYFIGNMVYSQQGAIGNMPMAAAFTLVPIVLIALYLAFVKRLGAFDAL